MPSVATGAQGVGAALVAGSHDTAGAVTWGTPAAPAAGALFTVTFGTPIAAPGGNTVFVQLTPGNAATAAAVAAGLLYATVNYDAQGRAIGFTVSSGVAQAASQGAGTYNIVYGVGT